MKHSILTAWREFEMNLRPDIALAARRDLRFMFYAGFSACLEMIAEVAEVEEMVGIAMMEGLQEEISIFAEQETRRRTKK